jgi:hypothetical protein
VPEFARALYQKIERDGSGCLTQEVDNDVETDEEIVESEIDRCCGWLKSAIQGQAGPS